MDPPSTMVLNLLAIATITTRAQMPTVMPMTVNAVRSFRRARLRRMLKSGHMETRRAPPLPGPLAAGRLPRYQSRISLPVQNTTSGKLLMYSQIWL